MGSTVFGHIKTAPEEELLRRLPAPILMVDVQDRRFIFANEAMCRLLGYSEDEFLRMGISDLHPPEELPRALKRFETAVQSGGEAFESLEVLRKNGSTANVIVRGSVTDFRGKPTMCSTVTDIGTQMQLWESLKQQETQFRHLFDHLSQGVIYYDGEGNLIRVNRAALDLLGLDHASFARQKSRPPGWRVVDETRRPVGLEAVPHRIVLRTGSAVEGAVFGIQHPDRPRTTWVIASCHPERCRDTGCLLQLVTTLTDITRQRQAIDELERSKKLFERASEAALIGAWELDLVSGKLTWSPVTREIHEVPEDYEPTVASALDFYDGQESKERLRSAMMQTSRDGKRYEFQLPFRTYKGRHIWIQTNAQGVFRDGKCIRLYGTFQDITEKKKAEEDLLARQAAEASNAAKGAFLANMSHEIRTPLNAIMGFAQVLKRDEGLSMDQLRQVQTIHKSAEHLLGMINDLLDLSKIEAGQVPVNEKDLHLHDLLDEIVILFRYRAERKGLAFEFSKSSRVPAWIRTDPIKLRQVLSNLLSNAIKFTSKGKVSLYVSPSEDTDLERPVLRFLVRDTGPGIANEETSSIFDTFYQGQAGQEFGGAGLGLSISRNLAGILGGALSYEGANGNNGASFLLKLPLKPAECETRGRKRAAREVLALKAGQPDVRILVVEGMKDYQQFILDLLEPVGFKLRICEDIEKALILFHRWLPQVILVDDLGEETRRGVATIRQSPGGQSCLILLRSHQVINTDDEIREHDAVDGVINLHHNPEDFYELLEAKSSMRFDYRTVPTVSVPGPAGHVKEGFMEQLKALPESFKVVMRDAVSSGDLLKLRTELDRLKPRMPELADYLDGLATDYAYDRLLDLLKPGPPRTPGGES